MSVYLNCTIMELQTELIPGSPNQYQIYRFASIPGPTYVDLVKVVSFQAAKNLKSNSYEPNVTQVTLSGGMVPFVYIDMTPSDFATKIAQVPNFTLIT